MTAKEFNNIMQRLDVTQGEMAKLLGRCIRSVNGYANGKPIPKPIELLLKEWEDEGRI
jgi:hypothetical protein